MTWYFWLFVALLAGLLQFLLLSLLIKGPYRSFPFLFVYLSVLFVTTVVDSAAYLSPAVFWKGYRSYYWINESLRQFLMFTLVMSLIYKAMASRPNRAATIIKLVLAAAAVTVLSIYFIQTPKAGQWWVTLMRNLSVCTVLLNLVLWLALIRDRSRDRLLLMLSGGLGIQMAGEALAYSLRRLSREISPAGNYVASISFLLCLYIWLQAIRTAVRATDPRFNAVERPAPSG